MVRRFSAARPSQTTLKLSIPWYIQLEHKHIETGLAHRSGNSVPYGDIVGIGLQATPSSREASQVIYERIFNTPNHSQETTGDAHAGSDRTHRIY